jgi:hypothetical protein
MTRRTTLSLALAATLLAAGAAGATPQASLDTCLKTVKTEGNCLAGPAAKEAGRGWTFHAAGSRTRSGVVHERRYCGQLGYLQGATIRS